MLFVGFPIKILLEQTWEGVNSVVENCAIYCPKRGIALPKSFKYPPKRLQTRQFCFL